MTVIYGHRGAKGEAPENTLASFQHCLEQRVRRCELDIRLSKDGELMVIHDAGLKRTTGMRGKVAEHMASSLVRMDARRNTPGWSKPCPIPRLEDLFAHCPFDHWQLEIKRVSRQRAAQLMLDIDLLCRRYNLTDKVTITSSSRIVLRAARKLTPHLSRGLVVEYDWLNPLKVAARYGCDLLALKWTLCTPELLRQAQRQGLHVSVWTINTPELMQEMVTLGVDSIITDFPSLAVQTLGLPGGNVK